GLAGAYGTADGTNGDARFGNYRGNAEGMAVDKIGNIYVTDSWNHTIRKLTQVGSNWVVTTIAGLAESSGSADGTNTDARFYSPFGVAVDAAGDVYVADSGNSAIRKLTPAGTNWVTTTVAGLAGNYGNNDGTNNAARFNWPACVAS